MREIISEETKVRLSEVLQRIERNGKVDLKGIRIKADTRTAAERDPQTGEKTILIGERTLIEGGINQIEIDLAHERKHCEDFDNPEILGKPILIAEQRAMAAEIPVLEAQGNEAQVQRMKAVVADTELVRDEFERRQETAIPDPSLRQEFVDWYLSQPLGRINKEKHRVFLNRIRRSVYHQK